MLGRSDIYLGQYGIDCLSIQGYGMHIGKFTSAKRVSRAASMVPRER